MIGISSKVFKNRFINGTVISESINTAAGRRSSNSFIFKIDDEPELIEELGGISEVVVKYETYQGFYIKSGDKIDPYGDVIFKSDYFWRQDVIWINAHHVYNKTRKCGY